MPTTGNTERFTYQPAADGKRFYVKVPVAGTSPLLLIVLHGQSGQKR